MALALEFKPFHCHGPIPSRQTPAQAIQQSLYLEMNVVLKPTRPSMPDQACRIPGLKPLCLLRPQPQTPPQTLKAPAHRGMSPRSAKCLAPPVTALAAFQATGEPEPSPNRHHLWSLEAKHADLPDHDGNPTFRLCPRPQHSSTTASPMLLALPQLLSPKYIRSGKLSLTSRPHPGPLHGGTGFTASSLQYRHMLQILLQQ